MGFVPYTSPLTIPLSVVFDADTSFQVPTSIPLDWALPMDDSSITSTVNARIRLFIFESTDGWVRLVISNRTLEHSTSKGERDGRVRSHQPRPERHEIAASLAWRRGRLRIVASMKKPWPHESSTCLILVRGG